MIYLRLIGIFVIVGLFPAGFVVGCMDEQERHEQTKAIVRAEAQAQERRTREIIKQHENAQREIEAQYAEAVKDRKARYAALYARYNKLLHSRASSSDVPSSAPSSTVIVQGSGTVCYDAEQLEQGVRTAVAKFALGAAELLQRGEEAIDRTKWWGDFARRVEACPNLGVTP